MADIRPQFIAHSANELLFSSRHKLIETGLTVLCAIGIIGIAIMALGTQGDIFYGEKAAGTILASVALLGGMLYNIGKICVYSWGHLRERN